MSNGKSFPVGMDFKHVHKTISEHLYETPLAFLRENVQNALDAIRMQAHAEGKSVGDQTYEIAIRATESDCIIRDNGIAMSAEELRKYFWTIGASGKRTQEARAAGCVGMFGIGGFANFGVCNVLTVTSRKEDQPTGTLTRLTEDEINNSTTQFPIVHVEDSHDADPRGTVVAAQFKSPANVAELKSYISSFVRFAVERVTFNDALISQANYFTSAQLENLTPLTRENVKWTEGDIELTGQLFRDQSASTIIVRITGLRVAGEEVPFQAHLRMENGPIDVLKRGFKLCATTIQTQIGISGRIDCDRMSPTAGRDSLNSQSIALLQRVANCLEALAVAAILPSKELLSQHARIYRYVSQRGWIGHLGKAEVSLADGSTQLLESINETARNGVGVFFGAHQKQALSQIMQARGNLVVLLPSDRYRRSAVQSYLTTYCGAKPFSGIVDFQEVYQNLDRFERVFLSELELTIQSEFDVRNVKFTAGNLTEDIPVYLSDASTLGPLEIAVDVRHAEIAKLRKLEFGPLLYSLIGSFCREYLGAALRKQSPKFFGSGAINLDSLEKKRSELWVLVKDDIHTLSRTAKRQVVRRSDVHTITAGGGGGSPNQEESEQPLVKNPKLLHIQGDAEFADILGYYLRIPDPATKAFGDVIKQYDNRAIVWAGNKVLFVASDGISSAFQFEVRLDHVITTSTEGVQSMEGAQQSNRPIQDVNDGLYFPIPPVLEPNLVPGNDEEIRIEVSSGDWIDTKSAHAWRAREEVNE
ncbi:MAG TPA: ATP-binding protein [Thermoguttaceae bacterium]|nr:ATP-binding protein [Thermoguttaceae bacterium]